MLLSIIVCVIDGGPTLERCLAALAAQQDPPPLDIVVPYDPTIPFVPEVVAKFPGVRTVTLPPFTPEEAPGTPAGEHELYDRRRATGLANARGELVAMIEDRGPPQPTWARAFLRLHERGVTPVVGGAVANGRSDVLGWADYLADFCRYQPPFKEDFRDYVTDINVCYRREALEPVRDVWAERFHESIVHWVLQRRGIRLLLSPEPVVMLRRAHLTLGRLVRERVAWGRLFGQLRSRELSRPRRVMMVLLSPGLPLLLFWRIARRQLALPTRGEFLAAAPALALVVSAWCIGEAIGYVRGAD